MLQQILKDLAISLALCIGERLLERSLFPGLHRLAARGITDDPARIEGLSFFISQVIVIVMFIWLFNGTLYVVAWLIRRPLRPVVPTIVSLIIVTVFFLSALAEWYGNPSLPPAG
jgi:hypothetical protein